MALGLPVGAVMNCADNTGKRKTKTSPTSEPGSDTKCPPAVFVFAVQRLGDEDGAPDSVIPNLVQCQTVFQCIHAVSDCKNLRPLLRTPEPRTTRAHRVQCWTIFSSREETSHGSLELSVQSFLFQEIGAKFLWACSSEGS